MYSSRPRMFFSRVRRHSSRVRRLFWLSKGDRVLVEVDLLLRRLPRHPLRHLRLTRRPLRLTRRHLRLTRRPLRLTLRPPPHRPMNSFYSFSSLCSLNRRLVERRARQRRVPASSTSKPVVARTATVAFTLIVRNLAYNLKNDR